MSTLTQSKPSNPFSNASRSPLHSKPDPKGETRQPLPPTDPTALSALEAAKQLAAYVAVDEHILPHHRVIGIGSGTTVPYVVERIVQQGFEANESRWFIPTGFQSKELIVKAGLNLGDVDQFPSLDITLDGADEVDADLNAIKGGGACHLREKVLAEAAETFVLVADARKDSGVLGSKWKGGVPIEVVPFAWAKVIRNIQKMGCPNATLRMGKSKAGPVVTDNGNFVIDAPFDEVYMRDPMELGYRLKMLTGVLEVGLFCGMAQDAYFGNPDGSVTIRSRNGSTRTLSAKEGRQRFLESPTNSSSDHSPSPNRESNHQIPSMIQS
ncbi:ribose 5-phosphate isomerase A-domain-containing protein [Melampsora americana]|nr:ribose 5-phosphate isomerase A-domain-containing protein [Melampsora americana]